MAGRRSKKYVDCEVLRVHIDCVEQKVLDTLGGQYLYISRVNVYSVTVLRFNILTLNLQRSFESPAVGTEAAGRGRGKRLSYHLGSRSLLGTPVYPKGWQALISEPSIVQGRSCDLIGSAMPHGHKVPLLRNTASLCGRVPRRNATLGLRSREEYVESELTASGMRCEE